MSVLAVLRLRKACNTLRYVLYKHVCFIYKVTRVSQTSFYPGSVYLELQKPWLSTQVSQ